jgi:hypothetical protein
MSNDADDREGFLSRWSRAKVEARETAAAPAAPAAAAPASAQDEPPELPPVEELTIDSDYRGFFHPKVDEGVRRSALRKLFSDPHFNVMDGLDVYIDDYSKSEPIPAAMLAGLKQAQRIIEWASETDEAAAIRRSTPPSLPTFDEPEEVAAPGVTDDVPDIAPEAPGAPESTVATRATPVDAPESKT